MRSPSRGPTRTEADFVAHLTRTIDTDPDGMGVFVMDQLHTQQSESLVRFIADRCGIPDDLGRTGKAGILPSMPTRAACLSDPAHRIQLLYVPKHTSWLNQIEIWFGILVRRVLKRGNFPSLAAVQERIRACITYFNLTAKPFKWTYTGRPFVA